MNPEFADVKKGRTGAAIRETLGCTAMAAIAVVPAVGLIVFSIWKGGWLLIVGSIVLSPVVAFAALGIAALVEKLYESLFHVGGPYPSFPGSIMPSSQIGRSSVSTTTGQKPPIKHNSRPLVYTTDGVTIESIDNDLILHIMFALYNPSPTKVTVHDIHARVYIDHIEDAALILPENRAQILLSTDNSLLSHDKTYPVGPDEDLSVDLAVRVTKTNEGIVENTICVFGLVVHYRRRVGDQVDQLLLPSDAIYIFRNPPADYMGNRNFVKFTAEDASGLPSKSTGRILSGLLRRHLSQKPGTTSDGRSGR